jgi:hypothetical protein
MVCIRLNVQLNVLDARFAYDGFAPGYGGRTRRASLHRPNVNQSVILASGIFAQQCGDARSVRPRTIECAIE